MDADNAVTDFTKPDWRMLDPTGAEEDSDTEDEDGSSDEKTQEEPQEETQDAANAKCDERDKLKRWLRKVGPLLDHIKEVNKIIFTPGNVNAIDEMMVRFFGRSGHTYRMKNKPIKEGFKFESSKKATFWPQPPPCGDLVA